MNELSTIINEDYILVFYDGSKKQIDKNTGEKLLELSTTAQKTFILAGQLYSFASISKLIPLKEYYGQYPEKRPIETPAYKSEPQEPFNIYKQVVKNKRRIEQSIIGIKRYMDTARSEGREPTQWSYNHLAKLEKLLVDRTAALEFESPIQSIN